MKARRTRSSASRWRDARPVRSALLAPVAFQGVDRRKFEELARFCVRVIGGVAAARPSLLLGTSCGSPCGSQLALASNAKQAPFDPVGPWSFPWSLSERISHHLAAPEGRSHASSDADLAAALHGIRQQKGAAISAEDSITRAIRRTVTTVRDRREDRHYLRRRSRMCVGRDKGDRVCTPANDRVPDLIRGTRESAP